MTVPPAFSAEGAKKVEISRSLSRLGSDWSDFGGWERSEISCRWLGWSYLW